MESGEMIRRMEMVKWIIPTRIAMKETGIMIRLKEKVINCLLI